MADTLSIRVKVKFNHFELIYQLIRLIVYSVALKGPAHSTNTEERIEWNGSDFNSISDEMLLKIFEFLDVVDLNNCELVCRRWRNVILYGNVWMKLLCRKVRSLSANSALDKRFVDLNRVTVRRGKE